MRLCQREHLPQARTSVTVERRRDPPSKTTLCHRLREMSRIRATDLLAQIHLTGTARNASIELPEVKHIRTHMRAGLHTRAALHLIIPADLAHRGRDGVLVIGLVLGGNRQTRLEARNRFVRAR